LKLVVHEQADSFTLLKAEWNDLVQRSSANTIFSTWEWMSTWWTAYQPGSLHIVTCHTDDGTLAAIAPWFITQTEAGQSSLSTIGCKEVTDYLDLIVDDAYTDAVLPRLAAHLKQTSVVFDTIFLCNIAEDSITYREFPLCLEEQGFLVELHPEDVCPVVSLPGEWKTYLEQLDKKQRHEVRRKLRRALGQNSEVSWYIVDASHNLDEEMSHFFRLMAASDPEKADFLQDDNNQRFFQSITAIMLERGWLQLSFLTVEGMRAAAYLNFDYAGTISVYNSGLDQQNYGHLSPGIVLLAFNIEHAIETGHHTFDFLQGDEEYKYRMGGQDRRVFNLEARLDEGVQ
jgi:CelD/BcsL family acetyltransferase involved in cellulose biosynthesis